MNIESIIRLLQTFISYTPYVLVIGLVVSLALGVIKGIYGGVRDAINVSQGKEKYTDIKAREKEERETRNFDSKAYRYTHPILYFNYRVIELIKEKMRRG